MQKHHSLCSKLSVTRTDREKDGRTGLEKTKRVKNVVEEKKAKRHIGIPAVSYKIVWARYPPAWETGGFSAREGAAKGRRTAGWEGSPGQS